MLQSELRRCIAGLETDTTLVDLLTREALAAQSYWKILAGTLLPWPDWAKRRISKHWAQISPRATGRLLMREATDPFNAMLNYGYTLLEVEGRMACAAFGLDLDLGLLHVDDRLRESFIYDLIEPVRVKVDSFTFEFCIRKGLRPWMFHELRDGVVRLDPDIFGLGGGIIHVPSMVFLFGFPAHIATATSHFIIAVTSFIGTASHIYYNDVLLLPALSLSS